MFTAIGNKYSPVILALLSKDILQVSKTAKMNCVELGPPLEKHKQPVQHISTPMASFEADRSDMSERFTHCHLFIVHLLAGATLAGPGGFILNPECYFSLSNQGRDLIKKPLQFRTMTAIF